MRVAYVTAEACGTGHAVRGVALVRAGRRAGIEVRAFGPPVPDFAADGYEASEDWEEQAAAFEPDLLLGDVAWIPLDALRHRLAVPAWLLVRWTRPGWLRPRGMRRPDWDRRIAIEPVVHDPILTHRVQPIVSVQPDDVVPSPYDGQDVHLMRDLRFPVAHLLTKARSIIACAGYNTYWESVWLGYDDRVAWVKTDRPEQTARVVFGGTMTANGADEIMAMVRAG